MDESQTTQNRRSRRSHMMMTATLDYSGRVVKVTLRNLSQFKFIDDQRCKAFQYRNMRGVE